MSDILSRLQIDRAKFETEVNAIVTRIRSELDGLNRDTTATRHKQFQRVYDLSRHVRKELDELPDYVDSFFADPLELMRIACDGIDDIPGIEVNGPRQMPSRRMIEKKRFVVLIGKLYRDNTGEEPRTSTDRDRVSNERTGPAVELLLLAADIAGISTQGLAEQAHHLWPPRVLPKNRPAIR